MLLNIITINQSERKKFLSGLLFSISASCRLIASSHAKAPALRLPLICSAATWTRRHGAGMYRVFLSCADIADVADVLALAHLPAGRLEVDGASSVGHRALHPHEEISLGAQFFAFFTKAAA